MLTLAHQPGDDRGGHHQAQCQAPVEVEQRPDIEHDRDESRIITVNESVVAAATISAL